MSQTLLDSAHERWVYVSATFTKPHLKIIRCVSKLTVSLYHFPCSWFSEHPECNWRWDHWVEHSKIWLQKLPGKFCLELVFNRSAGTPGSNHFRLDIRTGAKHELRKWLPGNPRSLREGTNHQTCWSRRRVWGNSLQTRLWHQQSWYDTERG